MFRGVAGFLLLTSATALAAQSTTLHVGMTITGSAKPGVVRTIGSGNTATDATVPLPRPRPTQPN